MDLRRRRESSRRGADRGAVRARARGARNGAMGPAGPALARALHRAPAEDRSLPDYLVPLGRTVGFGANGAVSNLGVFHYGVNTMRRELRAGGFDVVHVHSPEAPVIGWDACSFRGAPVVGTFHSYSTKPLPNWIANALGARRKFNQLHARIAVSQGGFLDRAPLVRRHLPRDPERRRRRRPAGRAQARVRRVARALRRPPRGAQGATGAAPGVRGPGRARPRPAHGHWSHRRRRQGLPGRPRGRGAHRRAGHDRGV